MMGFLSKLFGKNEPGQQVAQQAAIPQQGTVSRTAATPVQPLDLKVADVVNLLGGKNNIADLKTCAYTRVRVQLKSPVSGIEDGLRAEGLMASMSVNNHVIHLLAGLQAEAVCDALKRELTG